MQTKHYALLALIIGVIIGVGAWIIFVPKAAKAPSSTATSTNAMGSSTVVILPNGTGVAVSGNATVEVVNDSIPHPSLTRPITFGPGVSADQQATLTAQEQADIAALTKDPTRVDLWLKLGNERKLAGDYAGAIEAWTYVAKAGPNTINYIAYGNMGDLYMNFDKDYAKAEANLKAAIAIKPTAIDYYRHLVDLYTTYGYGTKAQAQAVISQGLKANPNNPDLLAMQARLNAQTQ